MVAVLSRGFRARPERRSACLSGAGLLTFAAVYAARRSHRGAVSHQLPHPIGRAAASRALRSAFVSNLFLRVHGRTICAAGCRGTAIVGRDASLRVVYSLMAIAMIFLFGNSARSDVTAEAIRSTTGIRIRARLIALAAGAALRRESVDARPARSSSTTAEAA